ncbi:hypothetical protein M3M35_07115 [Fructilactobacillus myrtifloralis]|uniref:Uncharacterized protein n=1 Tax=Fructilactobacillus myrtifloralis TaxID=2940301 RepID=A0ABY5BN98_9LACO|nr:hypothetical protein [Fructilactobacillus myrtifloralis]USS85052.1 hypothetical protein M3M35_07115 [Fructilactobacillus myrtifloralis]
MKKDYEIHDSARPADDIQMCRNHIINYLARQQLTKSEAIEVVRSLDNYYNDDRGYLNVKGNLKRGD